MYTYKLVFSTLYDATKNGNLYTNKLYNTVININTFSFNVIIMWTYKQSN